MVTLDLATDNLKIVLSNPVTTNQMQVYAGYKAVNASAITPRKSTVVTNNTTAVTVIAAPAASNYNVMDFMSVHNKDTDGNTVKIYLDANGVEITLFQTQLLAGESLHYNATGGFYVNDARGNRKAVEATASGPLSSTTNMVVLASNVINNNAVANTLQDVTGLSFPVVAGVTYDFKFLVPYNAAATTTGSRWTITGPANSFLKYLSRYSASATTETINANSTYGTPAAANAASTTVSNMVELYGLITPTADGVVQLQFASEIAASAITALAGGYVKYQAIA